MKMLKKKRIYHYFCYLFAVSFCFVLFFIVASGNQRASVITYNVNNAKSIQATRMQDQYHLLMESKKPAVPLVYETFEEAITVAQTGILMMKFMEK